MKASKSSQSSSSKPDLTRRQIQVLDALYENAYETAEIEYPWYLLWNECFTQLNALFSNQAVHLTVGPQQQFTKRKSPMVVSDSTDAPNTRSNYTSGKSSPLLFLDEGEDCPMGDASFGSHITNDGPTALVEKVEAQRIPDFAIFRLPLQPLKRTFPLPSAIIENKPIGRLDIGGSLPEDFRVQLAMDQTMEQAKEQLECLFEEYPLVPGQPDPLPKVYQMIIVGGWFRIEEVTRDTWKNFPLHQIKATNMFEDDEEKKISRVLLEFWPKLCFPESG